MAINNSLKSAQSKPRFSVALQSDAYKNLINNTLRDPARANKFVANISSAVATNPMLQECDAGTILSGALLGESLNLSPSPQLGQFYLVPYKDNKNDRMVAQFQIGYKGYIQLAIRSGYYIKLNVLAIKEGELINYNPLNEEIKVNLIEDDESREDKSTIGYYAMFEYTNGFKKAIYWSKKKMIKHAKKYSQGYKKDLEKGTDYTFWSKDFDGMAYKTMLRQLISKWGIMSTEMQNAFEKDMTSISTDGKIDYVDNQPDVIQSQQIEINKQSVAEEQSENSDNKELDAFEGDF